jgi:hypothetical protein
MLEYAYTSNDNEVIVQFQTNDLAADISAATKMQIEFFNGEDDRAVGTAPVKTFNSIDDPTLFDVTDLATGIIKFKPGPADLDPLTADEYFTRWVIFSPDFTNGLIWGNDLVKYIVAR